MILPLKHLLLGVISFAIPCRCTQTPAFLPYNGVVFGCENELWQEWEQESWKVEEEIKTDDGMGGKLHSRSSIKPSTARRPAASGAIGNVDCGSGRGREEVLFYLFIFFFILMSTPSLLPLGCSFGLICCSSGEWKKRRRSLSGWEKNKRDRIV